MEHPLAAFRFVSKTIINFRRLREKSRKDVWFEGFGMEFAKEGKQPFNNLTKEGVR